MRQLALLALLLTLAGCATKTVIVNTFEGTPQAVATIKPVAFIVIRKIDGRDYYINPSSGIPKEYELGLLPGEHTFQLDYADGTSTSRKQSELRVDVTAGHRYIIRPTFDKNIWTPVLVDVSSRPECWTISVGTGLGPKGCS
jgi:hypothetical protein